MKVPPAINRIILASSAVLLLLPFLASLAALGQRLIHVQAPDVFALSLSLLVVIGVFALAVQFVCRTYAFSDSRFLSLVIGIVFALKLVWIAFHSGYPQLADHAIFLDFVNRLARAGFSGAELTRLSASYDYYIWVSRGFPFLHLLARWLPEHHVVAAMVLNAVWQCATLVVVSRIAMRIIPSLSARRVGIILLAAIPFHWWQVLEYGHHILSTCLIACAILAAIKIAESVSWMTSVGWSLLLGVLFSVLALQIGVDQLGFGMATLAAVATVVGFSQVPPSGWRFISASCRVVAGLMIAVLIWFGFKSAYFDWQASYDEHHLSSGVAGFMARGWSVEQWGEYDGRFEQIDRITPPGENKEAMLSMVASRLYHQPVLSFAMLLPVKIAKYGLIGFATTAEDSLNSIDKKFESSLFRWMRLFHAPLFLALALVAVYGLLANAHPDVRRMLPAVFPLAAGLVFTLMGETSPRYSIYVQPYMALLAGSGLMMIIQPANASVVIRGVKGFMATTPVILVCYIAASVLLWGISRQLPSRFIMAKVKAVDENNAIRYEPFAAGLKSPGVIESDELPGGAANFYAWRSFESTGGVFIVSSNGRELLRMPVDEMPAAQSFRVQLTERGPLQFSVEGGELSRVGYLRGGL
jgi:hypothetical protein